MPEPAEQEPVVEFDPPAASVAWSPEFVTQTLEVLFVWLGPDGARSLRPVHADSLRLGWPPPAKPGELVVEAAERYGLRPLLVHSTSWRHEEARVVITYLAVVRPPEELSPHLADEPVGRSDLARGDAFGPPPEIGVTHVLEHALRHLAWLVKDDAVVREALGDAWGAFLDRYVPEPFRPLDSAR